MLHPKKFGTQTSSRLDLRRGESRIPDFSHWTEHDQFEAAFARLLQTLRAETRAK